MCFVSTTPLGLRHPILRVFTPLWVSQTRQASVFCVQRPAIARKIAVARRLWSTATSGEEGGSLAMCRNFVSFAMGTGDSVRKTSLTWHPDHPRKIASRRSARKVRNRGSSDRCVRRVGDVNRSKENIAKRKQKKKTECSVVASSCDEHLFFLFPFCKCTTKTPWFCFA